MMAQIKYCPLCRCRLKKTSFNGLPRLKCSKCEWINYENPVPCVAALVKRGNPDPEVSGRGEEILLVQRGVPPYKGRWSLPSGFIEVEESPHLACLRELREETDLKGKILNLIGVYSQKSRNYKRVLVVAYKVKAENKKPVAGDDTKDVNFFPLNNLPPIPFKTHLQIIRDSLKS